MNTNESTVSTGATYTTQMDAARKGIITPEMKIVAQKEKMTEEELRELVACGKVVIPANKNHKSLYPEGSCPAAHGPTVCATTKPTAFWKQRRPLQWQ